MAQSITLRKADALSKALLEEARKVELSASVEVSIFDETAIETLAERHDQETNQALDSAVSLLSAGYAIREELAHAFVSSGISDLLAERAKLDAEERLHGKVTAKESGATAQRLAKAKLATLKEAAAAPSTGYRNNSETLTVQANPQAFDRSRARLRDIRRRKSEIADMLLERNMKHTIEVEDATIALAETLKLI